MEVLVLVLFIWLPAAFVIASAADNRGRNTTGWFFLTLLLTPLFTGAALALLGTTGKQCPDCIEKIRKEARTCKHCGHQFATGEQAKHT